VANCIATDRSKAVTPQVLICVNVFVVYILKLIILLHMLSFLFAFWLFSEAVSSGCGHF
jgi:hypothetical protein